MSECATGCPVRPLWIPKSGSAKDTICLEDVGAVVLVGANGAGKSRLAARIEQLPQGEREVHRVGAQRALMLPHFIQPKLERSARKHFLYGREKASAASKANFRWRNGATTSLLNDFEAVLVLLFAQEVSRDKKFRKTCQALQGQDEFPPVPESSIDRLRHIWAHIMPQRELRFDDGKITSRLPVPFRPTDEEVSETTPDQVLPTMDYPASEMSDGERVAIYLVGQVLCVPTNAVVVIDEPEIHLHRSVLVSLWDCLEQERPDCTFVYATHDIHFAASRASARILWVESFDGKAWTWTHVQQNPTLPPELRLELLGNRRPVLFVEGEKDSYDSQLLRHVYPHMHVVPRGGCDKVVEATRAFRTLAEFHHLSAVGLIDRDHRPESELEAYRSSGVEALPVAEIEGLFLLPDVVRGVAAHQRLDPEATLSEVKRVIVSALDQEKETQIAQRACYAVEYQLKFLNRQAKDRDQLKEALSGLVSGIDVDAAFADAASAFEDTSYSGVLRAYNRKSLPSRISQILDLRNGKYPELVLRLITGGGPVAETILQALRDELPSFPPAEPSTSSL